MLQNGYRGKRLNRRAVVVVVHHGEESELKHIDRHSRSGFEWGYAGSGPADLALSILSHATGRQRLSEKLHQQFKFDVISKIRRDAWELHERDVHNWIAEHADGALLIPHVVTGVMWGDPPRGESGNYGVICTSIGNFRSDCPLEAVGLEDLSQYYEQVHADWEMYLDGDMPSSCFTKYEGKLYDKPKYTVE